MFAVENTELGNIVFLFIALGFGWFLLRFLLRLARKLFIMGCLAIVLVGFLLIAIQLLEGV